MDSVRRHGQEWVAYLLVASTMVVLTGCGNRYKVAPVEGKVSYNGVPLKFGSVVFQPEVGPRATGLIQPDGTFRLSTYGKWDGAVLGKHRITIVCAQHQNPENSKKATDPEGVYSPSLIPERYSFPETSGFEVEVQKQNQPFEFRLTK